MQNLDRLNQQFAIADHIHFSNKNNGLTIAKIANSLANAEISLQGAHLFNWQPRGQSPIIWLSQNARFEQGKAIRGGIPICWPWFGAHEEDPKKPAHGFVRTEPWTISTTKALNDGRTRISFSLCSNPQTLSIWPYSFRLTYSLTIGQTLELHLLTENTGDSTFEIGESLHSYFAVADIEHMEIQGLAGLTYIDKTDNMSLKKEHGPVQIHSEIDYVYLDTPGQCYLDDSVQQRRISINAEGGRTTVVWNPWLEKSKTIDDLGDHGYRTMVCIESGNAFNNKVSVKPGKHHELIARYELI